MGIKKGKNPILVVDDDDAHRTMLRTLLGGWGYEISEADDGSMAVEAVKRSPFDLVLMDIRMLKVSGIEALDQIKVFNPVIPVIIMTAFSSVETAVQALKKGAYDYLTKPLDFDKLKLTIERAMEHTQLKEENRLLKENLGKHFDRQNIIGNSAAMSRLLQTVAQVAPSEATVLISGESGTGKELIAGAIHFNSQRKQGPFVKINCSIFLDEVSEMSPGMQVKLLRVLQEKEITRVGGEKVIPVDVRVISATNQSLLDMIKKRTFREDLYYRLNVVRLEIPPLRGRREDIPLLAQRFLKEFTTKNRKKIKGFTPQAMDFLVRYDWPGNVRELMNAIERSVVLARSEYLDAEDLSVIRDSSQMIPDSLPGVDDVGKDVPLDQVEKATILRTLESAGGNKSEAARRLGITRKTLHKKLKKYGMMT
jgi:two-component system response regulator HydG